jgi:hypothetical protein
MTLDILFEEFEKQFIPIIFEVSKIRSPILKKIETDFDLIRKNLNSREYIKSLELHIKEFAGIPKVVVSTKKTNFEAAIFPVYTRELPKIIGNNIKSSNPEDAKQYIKAIYLTLGKKIIKEFSPKQLTSILLHELGHVYQHTSNLGMIFPSLLNFLAKGGMQDLDDLKDTSPIRKTLTIPLIAAMFPLSRSLTFSDHMEELNADDYANRYGYGDELAKVFYKFNKWTGGKKKSSSWLGRIWDKMKKIFSLSTHPSDIDRVCSIIDKMKKDYKNKYPTLSKQISIIYADIKC